MRKVTTALLTKAISKIEGTKTRNNAVSVFKRAFNHAFLNGMIDKSPAASLVFKKDQPREPDPLSLEDIDTLLPVITEYHEEWGNYFELAFFTGMRPSEIIELAWGDIDFKHGEILVSRAKVGNKKKATKTYKSRVVRLNARSKAALLRQKAITWLADGLVFRHPVTKEPILDDKAPRKVWNFCLKKAGLRRRNAYQTRHTYATLLIMANEPVAWVARQMGHSVEMLFKRYMRWIDRASYSKEGENLDRLMGQFMGQK